VYPQTDGNGVLVSFPAAEAAGLDHFRISLDDFRPKLEILTGAAVQATVGGAGVAGSVQQLEPGQWNHLAFVIAPENKSLSIHLNGVLLIAQKVLINLNYVGTPSICRSFTDGYLDELRIWNYPRPVSDIEYWASRYYPAPGYVRLSADTRSGRTVQMYDYSDPHPLMLYLRFDDGGAAVENFAFLNHGLYPYPDTYRISGPITNSVTTLQAAPMFGSDDADGDELPEWWVDLHNMEKYQEYYTSAYGPEPVWCPDNGANLLGFEYFRAFIGYGSVGNQTGWNEAGSTVFHMPKTSPDFFEGDNSTYTKHVYIFTQPRSCPLSVFTPGMTSTVVYVNGERVTTTGDEGNQGQQYDVAQYMRIGRNTVHIQCKSIVALRSITGLPYSLDDYRAYTSTPLVEPLIGCNEQPYQFKVAQGKFDAELACNGMPVIVRGDKTRADARAVWHVQLWSTLFESVSQVPIPDLEYRDAESNPDYGVPLHAERENNPLDPDSADDGLDAVYEYIGLTNPRERDSNNNGVTDGDEDFDRDGLVNREEQRFGSSPWLADTDDDGIHDGIDVGDGHPAQSLSPQRNQSLRFGGGAGDFISMPLQQRFALEKWSIEAWIQPDADEADGGILAQRAVGGGAVNYEVGLDASNRPYARYVSVAGVEVLVSGSAAVVADGSTWTHVAATYYDRKLNLFINGTNVASQTGGSFPALYAGGPVQQRIGSGFKGCLDEWRLWKAQLTSERIVANRDEVLTGLEEDLVAYYRMDDDTSYDMGLPLVGTSANNGTNGALPAVAWQSGQVEDNVLRYSSDWWLQWKHAAAFAGNVAFSTNHIMQGPPRLQVFIENDDAVAAGARWSYNGGASWNESGFVETHLAAGDYNISFNAIGGWISPSALPLNLVRGQSTMVTGTYVQTASLTVIVDNNAAIKEVATWSIDGGGTRRGSGTRVVNLVPGAPGYDVLFSDIFADIPGWDRPPTFNVQLLPGESRTVSASYTAVQGALQIAFPAASSPSTARWRVSGNTNWWASGETVTNLAYGEHLVEYNTVPWWNAPADETVVIERSSPVYSLTRNWTKLPEPSLIPVSVTNASSWLNNPSNLPPHWSVAGSNGVLVARQGQVKLGLFLASDLAIPVDTQPIYPAAVGTLTDLGSIAGSSWVYSLGAPAADGAYRVVAWIDGNGNNRHDIGEPQGYTDVTIIGGKSLGNVSISIMEDTDGDGMADWWEVHWFGDLSQTGFMDDDNDGLGNGQEFGLIYAAGVYATPVDWDTDNDGMDDAWEVFYGLDPASAVGDDGATGDLDDDGLINLEEYLGTDRVGWREDPDGDGIAEYTASTDATHPRDADTDNDGVRDDDEVLVDLTHPVHPMSGTNFLPRSLAMNVNGGAGVAMTDPTGSTCAFTNGGGTVEFWIYPQTDVDGVLYAFPEAQAAGRDHFRISLDHLRPKLEMLAGATVKATVGGTNVLPTAGSVQQLEPNRWTHLAFVIDPVNKTVAIYADGVLLIAQTTFIGSDLQGTPTICSGFTDGYLDELRVWNYPRTLSDIEYWSNRYYPAPGYVQTSAATPFGDTIRMYAYSAPHPLMLYLRFDDGGSTVENFAFLNHGLYPYPDSYRISGPITNAVTTVQALPMFGSDDADGDGLPEWWVDLYNMEKYQEFYTTAIGPDFVYSADNSILEGVRYYRSFVGYASIGNETGWEDSSNAVYYMPKTRADFPLGENSTYTKHAYLFSQPRSCPLTVYTPGMTSTVVYVNGVRVTAAGQEGNPEQQYDVALHMKTGRNTVHVECISTTASEDFVPPHEITVAKGKFDAELTCNGMPVIVRGDKTRADPRAAWHVQVWSSYFAAMGGTSLPDREFRDARSNPDYGVPLHAERDNNPLDPDGADDGLDAVYELICGTNPRYRDSNNNGVPDGDEDYDTDGLTNREEQRFGSSPWLADSDDDGIHDGVDVGDGHPAQSLSPQRSQSLRFGGGAGDYITMPAQQRFALEKWSVETWIKPDADEADGGILVQRAVGGAAVNYEVGLNGSNRPYVRYVSVSGIETIATGSAAVVADGTTWTHVAATYSDRKLNLLVNGTNVASTTGSSYPALYAGGPVQQRIGAGFKGCLDEWRLWNVALPRARILASIVEVVTGLETDLVAYYRFDDGTSYDTGLPLVGTSANNGTNGSLLSAAWQWGQVEDNMARYASDWWQQWKYAASFAGNVAFSTNFIVQGAPRLQVFVEPDEAITAGARWSYDGGATSNESGSVIYDLAAGDYVISFNTIDGWITPANLPLTLVRGQTTVVTGTYVQAAALTVIIDNNADIKAAATWSIDGGGTLRGSGTKVINLVPGAPGYDILFSDISTEVPGWDRPATLNVQLLPGESRTVSATYTAVQGSLQISFTPTNAPSAARWRFAYDTNNWWASGQIVTNLAYGEHDVEYNEVAWWKAPTNETIRIEGSYLHTLSRAWEKLPEPSTLTVTITPADAIADGAQWGVNGTWYNSGQTVLVDAGSHVVTYRAVAGWLNPTAVTLEAVNAAAYGTGTYHRLDIIGSAENGGFNTPWGVAATTRYIYVADTATHRVQRQDRISGKWTVLGGQGTGAGQFLQPMGVAIADNGDLWVADAGNHRIQVLPAATGKWTPFGSYGSGNGQFNAPYDLEIDAAGNVYVADYHNSRIQKRQPDGKWSVIIQSGSQDARVRYPSGLAVDRVNQALYVSDYDPAGEGFAGRVQEFSLAGGFVERVGTSEPANGDLEQNMGLHVMNDQSLVVASTFNDQIVQRDLNGAWDTVLRPGVVGRPRDVSDDGWGNIVVSDSGNHRILILYTGTNTSSTLESIDGAVYRFWSDSLKSHFFTASAAERDGLIANGADVWTYEGIAFYVPGQAVVGSSPVHRFWSDRIGCHVFTISETEKATLESRYASVFTYEGPAWHAFTNQAPGTLPVYRFWAPKLKKPFFTISGAEKDNVIANMSDTWRYQGIAWYAYESASAISSLSIVPQSKASTASISQSFLSEIGQAVELPGSVVFGLSYGDDEVVSAMVHDPVATTYMQVLEPTLSPRELVIPPLPFGQRYWLSVMSHRLGEEKDALDYGGWLGRVADVPGEAVETVDVVADMPMGLPVENIALPESAGPLTLQLYERTGNRLVETIQGLEGGSTYELTVPAWNQWYRVDIVNEASGAVINTLWIGHLRTH